MLAVRRQRKPCRWFVDVSAARRGRQTTKHAVQIELGQNFVQILNSTYRARRKVTSLIRIKTAPAAPRRQRVCPETRRGREHIVQETTTLLL